MHVSFLKVIDIFRLIIFELEFIDTHNISIYLIKNKSSMIRLEDS
jgi:hypothetical protein